MSDRLPYLEHYGPVLLVSTILFFISRSIFEFLFNLIWVFPFSVAVLVLRPRGRLQAPLLIPYVLLCPIIPVAIYQLIVSGTGLVLKQGDEWFARGGTLTVFGATFSYVFYLAAASITLLSHLAINWFKSRQGARDG
jgi:hypothetical protein